MNSVELHVFIKSYYIKHGQAEHNVLNFICKAEIFTAAYIHLCFKHVCLENIRTTQTSI